MMRAHRIWTSVCRGCIPWVRVVPHPATCEAIVQTMHEDTCHVFPKLQRRGDDSIGGVR